MDKLREHDDVEPLSEADAKAEYVGGIRWRNLS